MDPGKLVAVAAFVIVVVVGLALRPKAAPPRPGDEGLPEVVAAPVSATAPAPPVAPVTSGGAVVTAAIAPASASPPPAAGGAGFVAQPIDDKAVEQKSAKLAGPEAFAELRRRQETAAAEFLASRAKPGPLITNAKPGITSEEVRKRDASFEEVRKKEHTFDTLPAPEQERVRGAVRSLEADIQANPADPALYGKLATVQREAKLEMMALDTLERGLAKSPDDLGLLTARAKVLADYGFGEKASAAYEHILKLKPGDAEAKAALETVRKVYLPGK